jgi:hypothetical protein
MDDFDVLYLCSLAMQISINSSALHRLLRESAANKGIVQPVIMRHEEDEKGLVRTTARGHCYVCARCARSIALLKGEELSSQLIDK